MQEDVQKNAVVLFENFKEKANEIAKPALEMKKFKKMK